MTTDRIPAAATDEGRGAQLRVIGWDSTNALAVVDGVRVRIRRSRRAVRWMCDEHGTAPAPHCPHTTILADSPAPPEKRSKAQRRTRH